MRIGDVAFMAGVSTQTIRFYERRGLLPEPGRGPNGYRDYDGSILPRLHFIRRGQAAGLTLVQISEVIGLRDEGSVPCAHVQSLLGAKLDEVRTRQRELASLEAELEDLLALSEQLDPADCGDTDICHVIGPALATG